MNNNFQIIGYSGHSFVVLESAVRRQLNCTGYYDKNRKKYDPFNLPYLGQEADIQNNSNVIITIGDNTIRKKIYEGLFLQDSVGFSNIIDCTATFSTHAKLTRNSSVFIGPHSVVNCFAEVEAAVIINTGSIVEHEAKIGPYSHVGPNATICGGAQIGSSVLVGANAVVKQGVKVGDNVVIGAGAVVIEDLQSESTYVGNPATKIR